MKWYTEIEIIDVETGEIISKSIYLRENYITIKKNKKYTTDGKYGKIKIEWETKKSGQTKIEWD